jgi:hypothetical protein
MMGHYKKKCSNVLVKVVNELKMLLNFDGVNYIRKNISVKKLAKWLMI